MSSQNHPKWWQLYLTFPLLVLLFAIETRLKISSRGHQIVQVGIIIFVFGLIHLWLKANSIALSNLDREQYNKTFTMTEFSSNRVIESDRANSPIFYISGSEIKGVLSDTFEMDGISAEVSPIEKFPQELNKE